MHGLAFIEDVLIFTNPKSHKIQLAADGHVRDLGGSGIGLQDSFGYDDP